MEVFNTCTMVDLKCQRVLPRKGLGNATQWQDGEACLLKTDPREPGGSPSNHIMRTPPNLPSPGAASTPPRAPPRKAPGGNKVAGLSPQFPAGGFPGRQCPSQWGEVPRAPKHREGSLPRPEARAAASAPRPKNWALSRGGREGARGSPGEIPPLQQSGPLRESSPETSWGVGTKPPARRRASPAGPQSPRRARERPEPPSAPGAHLPSPARPPRGCRSLQPEGKRRKECGGFRSP